MSYEFKWKPEILFAVGTLLATIGLELLRAEEWPPTELTWGQWLAALAIASTRATLAAVVPRLALGLSQLKSGASSILGSVWHLH